MVNYKNIYKYIYLKILKFKTKIKRENKEKNYQKVYLLETWNYRFWGWWGRRGMLCQTAKFYAQQFLDSI